MRSLEDLGRLGPILLVAFVAAALIALVLTPVVRTLALRFDFVDRPDRRRVNTRPVPRAGGLGRREPGGLGGRRRLLFFILARQRHVERLAAAGAFNALAGQLVAQA